LFPCSTRRYFISYRSMKHVDGCFSFKWVYPEASISSNGFEIFPSCLSALVHKYMDVESMVVAVLVGEHKCLTVCEDFHIRVLQRKSHFFPERQNITVNTNKWWRCWNGTDGANTCLLYGQEGNPDQDAPLSSSGQ